MDPSRAMIQRLRVLTRRVIAMSSATRQEFARISVAQKRVADTFRERFDRAVRGGTPQDILDLGAAIKESEIETAHIRQQLENYRFRLEGLNYFRREINVLFELADVTHVVWEYTQDGNLGNLKQKLKGFLPRQEDEATGEGEGNGGEEDDDGGEEEVMQFSLCTAQDIIQGFPWMRDVLREIGCWQPEGDGEGQSEEL
ncbi:hypothetical protein TWF281_002358 [Arthrobotrys megalospora]